MLPSMRQRLIVTAAAAIGAMVWMLALDDLRAPDGSQGLSLMTARIGPGPAALLIVVAGLPAILAGLLAAATGNPLSGVFAAAAALCVLAGNGGGMEGWVTRDGAVLPQDYWKLIIEMILWMCGLFAMLLVIQLFRGPLRSRLKGLAFDDHVGVPVDLRQVRLRGIASVLLCSVISGVLTLVMVRSTDSGQVIWSLILAFMIGAMVAHVALPQGGGWAVLLSPATVAIVAYTWPVLSFRTEADFLANWYVLGRAAGKMPGPTLALPIHYASAAVVGCALGVGWAQGLNAARTRWVVAKETDGRGDAAATSRR